MKIAAPILVAFISHAVHAQDVTWDTTAGDGSAITYGDGTWNLTNAVWNTGSGNVTWSNAPVKNAAIPGAASGVPTITIGSDALTVGRITVGGAGSTTVFGGSYSNLTANEIAIQTSGAGKLAFTSAATLSKVSAFSIANGATLFLQGATVNSSVSVQGNGNNENRGALRLDSGGTLQGTLTLLGDATFGSTSSGVIQSTITGGFAFNQASVSSGTMRLASDNGFTGGTTIVTGTVQAGHNNAFGSGTLRLNGGTLCSDSTTGRTFANPATIGGLVTLGSATLSGKLTFPNAVQSTIPSATVTTNSNVEFADFRASGTLNLAGNGQVVLGKFTALSSNTVLAGGTVTLGPSGTIFDTNGYNANVSTSLTGAAGFTKTGQGTLTLNAAASSFTGPMQVAAGTLKLGSRALPANLDIMPHGDSITFGANGGYRYPLYQHLLPIAPNFHYVGDSTVGPGPLPAGYQNHSGHSSYSTDDIRRNLDGLDFTTFNTYGGADRDPHGGRWITGLSSQVTYTVPNRGTFTYGPRAAISPDVILLLVGANDLYRAGSTNGNHHANYTALLNEIFRVCPDVHVFMAKVTPHATNDAPAVAFNAAVEQVYNEFKAAGKKVTLVDLHTGYTGGLPDGLHPDAAGYAWMAGKWRDALMGTLGVEAPLDCRNAPSLHVAPNATLTGSALVNQLTVQGSISPGDGIGTITANSASISGNYACEISGGTADLLTVQGNLDLANATLAFSTVQAPTAPVIPVATYAGALTGKFATVTGIPAGYHLVHDKANKRLVLATKSPYTSWRTTRGLPDEYFATTQDADADGVADIVEFATAGNPTQRQDRGTLTGGLCKDAGGEIELALTFAARAGATFREASDNALTATIDAITYRVECSEDLVQWIGTPTEIASQTDELPTAPPGYEYHSFKAAGSPATTTKNFLRLQVTGQ